MKSETKIHDLSGQKFGRLTVIGPDDLPNRHTYWVCQCDCGTVKSIRGDSMIRGLIKSCGCLKKEQDKINLAGHHKHLKSHTNLYNAWLGIKRRCYNPNDKSYSRWGGRGITVCDEWKNDFMSFYNWSIENGYEDGLTIDRIDNNGNYEPSNCRWASQKEQANNRRSNIDITIGNATKTLKEWCEIFELDYNMVNARYHRSDCRTLDYLFSQCKYRGKQ